MHHTAWRKGKSELLRGALRSAKFDAKPEDRLRLKPKVDAPTAPARTSTPQRPDNVSDIGPAASASRAGQAATPA
ncbi:hypothetical protein [Streptomyces sp. AS02]|uniref:hypothetical protein n=1 Tax=Streptomyces sp. AS02 TaxID=2938946 RepID=UPI002020D5CC|nr:hypothetical protein [Streptomyces sp. AS02]MCL8011402.1 hypothetical protein [Streptomyces sp. AS02]